MRLLISIVLLLLVISLAESVDVGDTSKRVLLLGSLSKNALNQANASNETNTTNQTNVTHQGDRAIAIKSPMSIIPVSNKYRNVTSPNSIQANVIQYSFTT